MFSKSLKWEVGFVQYIKKFTIFSFVISRFECTSTSHSNFSIPPPEGLCSFCRKYTPNNCSTSKTTNLYVFYFCFFKRIRDLTVPHHPIVSTMYVNLLFFSLFLGKSHQKRFSQLSTYPLLLIVRWLFSCRKKFPHVGKFQAFCFQQRLRVGYDWCFEVMQGILRTLRKRV